ncbi:MAG TPA: hypothetical protein VK162_03350, partial [Streptosporangiaceae bacterium]|nr:hypothetical protein [Streptosporangiaceae bacterium]
MALGTASASVSGDIGRHHSHVHGVRIIKIRHPHKVMLKLRHRRLVRARGRVVRARLVPWPGGSSASVGKRHRRARAHRTVRLTAYLAGGSGITEFPVPTPSSQPEGIAVPPDGTAWFAEETGNNLGAVTPGGAFTTYPLTGNGTPFGIT